MEEHVSVAAVADWTELLDSPADAVINALPTPEHHQVTKAFLEAGKHVLVKSRSRSPPPKPRISCSPPTGSVVSSSSGMSNASIRRCVGCAASSSGVGYGDIVTIAARRVGIARPVAPRTRTSSSTSPSTTSTSAATCFRSRRGGSVPASGRALWGNQQEDHADLVLRFGDAVAIVQANSITPIKIRRVTVTGTEGARRRRLSRAVSPDLSRRPGGVRRPAVGLLRRRTGV